MQENKGISILDAFRALDDLEDAVVAKEVQVVRKNQALKESLKESKIDVARVDMYEKGQAYFYARTGDCVDINGTKFKIDEDDTHKIGYCDEILLENLETGEKSFVAKKDFIKDAQLLKEDCATCKEAEDKYYVYLHSPAGTELICSGTKEECEKAKAEKDAKWKTGYMWHTELTNKPVEEVNLWDSLMEEKSSQLYIYQFPADMTKEDIQQAGAYDLEYLGKVNENGFQPGDYLIKGTLSALRNYCKKYLGYEMHPDYLYKEEDLDTDIISVKESCEEKKINEAPVYGLDPQYDARKSFYGKAQVDVKKDGTQVLYSYNTPVAMIKNGEVTLGKATNRGYPFAVWNYSQTTLRHVKEFLKQNGFTADSTKQMAQDYKCDFIRESLSEDLKLDLTASNKEEIIKQGKEALEKSEDEPELQVVDVDADTVDDLKSDYVGDIIVKCHKCGFKFFKDKDSLIKDEKTGLYNIEEPCNHCGAQEGYDVLGQVATANVDAEQSSEQDLTHDAPKEEEVKIETEVKEETPNEEENKRTSIIAKESLDTRTLIEKLEDFDEVSFDTLVNKYFNKIYENVESYKTTNCKFEDNKVLIEGTLKFNSGKEKETTFILSEDKKNKSNVRFDCINESLTNEPKAFSLVGKISNNTLMSESFSCNYKVNKLNEELLVRERFTLKEKKQKEVKEEVNE